MRVVVQRVSGAAVRINGEVHSSIQLGLLVFVGFEEIDSPLDIQWLSDKIVQLRIFPDEAGKMNCSLPDVNGEVLVISQFTLHASTKKGNRPSFIKAARPETAIPLYESFLTYLKTKIAGKVSSGVFGADMKVELINDGPVTILIDSRDRE